MTTPLPPNPSIENLKKRAKTLKKSWQAGDAAAFERVRAVHPQCAGASDEQLRTLRPRLTDCQLVLARESGFATWRDLKVALESADRDLPDQFVNLACLCYDDPHFDHRSFHAQAHALLRQNRWLGEANIWSAATAGNAAAVKAFLDEHPELANRPGPNGWVPLICACYSRVPMLDPTHTTFDVVRLLLDGGADPNAFTLKGNADERLDQTARRFTALTGLVGGGSTGLANQPPHPQWREVAELLLERGADPADEEALAITQGLADTSAKVEILLRHGLTSGARTKRTNSGGVTLMGRALSQAAITGDAESVKLLLAHGARSDEAFRGKTPWQRAMERGHLEIADALVEAGAPIAKMSELERFVSLCVAGNEQAAHAMLESIPGLLARAPKELVLKAAGGGRKEAVSLVLDLGFDPNFLDEVTALHNAAGGNEEIVRLLLRRGASPTVREPFYDATPVGWADFFDQRHIRDIFLSEGAICLFDALDFDRLERIADILARDPAALNRPFAECLSREAKAEDWQTPLVRMIDRGKQEAVRALLEQGADVTAGHPNGQSVWQLARDKGFHEIARLLEQSGASAQAATRAT
jgi:ankyrin repeat protein